MKEKERGERKMKGGGKEWKGRQCKVGNKERGKGGKEEEEGREGREQERKRE